MSAADIFEQLKALPPDEQEAFKELIHRWQAGSTIPKTVPGQWPDFLNRLRRIYGDKITSDSQSLISEMRGDR